MAIITKIRNQSGLLIGVIGVAMLLFIVGGDFLSGNNSNFSDQEQTIAEIHGQSVSYIDFEKRVRVELGPNAVDEKTRESVRQRVWGRLMHEMVMFKEYDEIGLSVSPDEIFYQIKSNNPSPILAQYFTDPNTGRLHPQLVDPLTGGLSSVKLLEVVRNMMSNKEGESQWMQIEGAIKLDRFSTKYHNLIKRGLFTTSLQAKAELLDKNTKISFDYVLKDYTSMGDSTIEVSQSDLDKYYANHNHEGYFQQKVPARSVEYVVFNVEPSESDINLIKEGLEEIKAEFESNTDDTLFVNQNSDETRNIIYYSEMDFPMELDSIMENADSGTVVGPYIEGGYYKMIKVLGEKFAPDSIKARHILVKIVEGDTTRAQALVDSLKKVIKRKDNFAVLAGDFSEDFGSAQEGGDLGWFTEGRMVKPFNDACFSGKVGDMPVVTSQFGIHLIEILEKTDDKRKILTAVVDRVLEPGKTTYDEAYNKASSFAIRNNTSASFKTAANELNMRVDDQVKEADQNIPGLPNSKEIIRWIFRSEKGEISEPFELDNMFVVAHLRDVRNKGTLSLGLDYITHRVKTEVELEKKAEKINTQFGNVSSIDDAATKAGSSIENIGELTFSSFSIPGIGSEKNLIGTLFGMKEGQTSQPIKDKRGVYVVKVNTVTDQKDIDLSNFQLDQARLDRNFDGRADYEVFEALKTAAKITDNRGKFY